MGDIRRALYEGALFTLLYFSLMKLFVASAQ